MKKNDQNDFSNKLKKLNEIRKSDSHEKTKASTDIINESKKIRFGDLSYIKRTKVDKRKLQICINRFVIYFE